MEQETELNIHKKNHAPLCCMDVDKFLDFSHKSARLSTMENICGGCDEEYKFIPHRCSVKK